MRRLLPFIVTVLFSFPAQAETVAEFCKGIVNTNDLVACLSKYNEKAKENLTNSFQAAFTTLDAEDGAYLKKTQQSWIDYRNNECGWEVRKEATESLKRVRELHCLIRMTTNRQATIDAYSQELHEQNRAQGVKPRWENVLYADNANIFWRAGKANVSDLNCDGQLENTLLGINNNNNQQEYVIAFVENTRTGKPSPLLMNLPQTMTDEVSGEIITCGPDVLILSPELVSGEACQLGVLNIKNGVCGMYEVTNTEKGFAFNKKGIEKVDTPKEDGAEGH